MRISISHQPQGEVIVAKEYAADFKTVEAIEQENGCLETKWGKFCVQEFWFEGIHLLHLEADALKPLSLEIEVSAFVCSFFFVLQGECTLSLNSDAEKRITVSAGESNFIYTTSGELALELSGSLKLFAVQLSEITVQQLLLQQLPLLGSVLKSVPRQPLVSLQKNLPVTPLLQTVLDAIKHCGSTGFIKRIFIQSKVLELLFLQAELYEKVNAVAAATSLKEYDIEKIYLAKSLVEQNLQNPCSLIELAHKVGLNDFKLKKGFKELVGNTVFGYLNDVRMDVARSLLLEQRKSVSEVAFEIGYKNPHHFTAAFKKKFGVLPSQLKG